MKQVIFNVGGALSTYIEFDDKTLLVDIGKTDSFHPINNFLLPLYKKRDSKKNDAGLFIIDQFLLSHAHNDHISGINEFCEYFYPDLLTCPNDNDGMDESHKINWDLFDDNENIEILKKLLVDRTPPLRATSDQNEFIYYLPPNDVEGSKVLSSESYCNNISIVVFLIVANHRIFLTGDIQKEGMSELIKQNHYLRNKLKGGVDILVAPHHGLKSSFSVDLFDAMKGNKTRCLNVISEKVSTDERRVVDTRYSSSDFCSGNNNLSKDDEIVCQIKTSRGHVFIDYSNNNQPEIEIITDDDVLIERFL
ncbi:MAG: MBL fold metallo-hydrolase [Bacteroidetes bacterium]|nr:MBL fold metallo-hydrolase [Bacteroidota bacterium]